MGIEQKQGLTKWGLRSYYASDSLRYPDLCYGKTYNFSIAVAWEVDDGYINYRQFLNGFALPISSFISRWQ